MWPVRSARLYTKPGCVGHFGVPLLLVNHGLQILSDGPAFSGRAGRVVSDHAGGFAAASDDGQAALRGAADAFTDAGKGDKARAVANVAMLAGVVAQMGALAGRAAQQSSTLAEEMRRLGAAELRELNRIGVNLNQMALASPAAFTINPDWTAFSVSKIPSITFFFPQTMPPAPRRAGC